MSDQKAEEISIQAASAFSPRSPVNVLDLFAGRYDEIRALVDSVAQAGLHIVVFGERGVGKSSLANILSPVLTVMDKRTPRLVVKVNAHQGDSFASVWIKSFDEVIWERETPRVWFNKTQGVETVSLREAFQISAEVTIDQVVRVLSRLPNSVWVFDEFDRLPRKHAAQFTDLIKTLSDNAASATIVLVGVAETLDGLIKDHASIRRALVQIQMPRMSMPELRQVLEKAGKVLGMTFDHSASDRVARISQGLPHYTHLVGLHSARHACLRRSFKISIKDVEQGLEQAVQQADHTIASTYATATHSAHTSALYSDVLLACAITACTVAEESMGYFQAVSIQGPLESILKRPVQIATFNSHLTDFASDKREKILERTGAARGYRYRFRDPLMPPFVIMKGLSAGKITAEKLDTI
jgi:Cdc6-like AAA superfamily ATPase